jgi:hypothetical protein
MVLMIPLTTSSLLTTYSASYGLRYALVVTCVQQQYALRNCVHAHKGLATRATACATRWLSPAGDNNHTLRNQVHAHGVLVSLYVIYTGR